MSDTQTETQERTFSDLTPYRAAAIASAKTGRKFTTNYMYQLARQGTIESNHAAWEAAGGRNSGFTVKFSGAKFAAWLKAQIAGAPIGGRTRQDAATIVAEYDDFDDVDLPETTEDGMGEAVEDEYDDFEDENPESDDDPEESDDDPEESDETDGEPEVPEAFREATESYEQAAARGRHAE